MTDSSSGPGTRPTLLIRIRNPRDREAWETFVKVYTPLVFGYCRGRGLQQGDAEDVTQEVFLQVSQSIRTFEYRPERGRFRGWLGQVTRSKLSRLFRKLGKERAAEQLFDDVMSPGQDTAWDEAFNSHVLWTAQAAVRPEFMPKTWRASEMLWLEKRDAPAVAAELCMELSAVYQAKFKVLKRLREKVVELAEDSVILLRSSGTTGDH